MTTRSLPPARSAPAGGPPAAPIQPAALPSWAQLLISRLHFYIGLLVGPFVLVAALSGVLYALTPQIEDRVYHDALYTDSAGQARPLAEQVSAARAIVGPEGIVSAVRPAPEPGTTTRVMFAGPGLGPSEHRAIFIDPVTAQVRGDLGVYGTSGVLPVRAWLDLLHRELHLGEAGRLYSELAASWLWIAALGGLLLWACRRPTARQPASGRLRRWHATLGVWALLGLMFFSATGLTWSQYAGGNIGVLRKQFGWGTPNVSTALAAEAAPSAHGGHAHHHGAAASHAGYVEPALFDRVLGSARAEGISATMVEIRPPVSVGRAWTVTEIDRSWPTQVDAVAVDPHSLTVTDRIRFEDFPLAAKLTRWGIDAHMGVLFGLPNQIILIGFGSALLVMVAWGYMMWWRRRPAPHAPRLTEALRRVPRLPLAGLAAGAVLLGAFLPLMGITLLGFLLVDAAIAWRYRVLHASRATATESSRPG